MRSLLVAIVVALLPASMALAQSGNPKTDLSLPQGNLPQGNLPQGNLSQGKLLPVKEPRTNHSCAGYGPDYVKVEGTGMCVQISGSVSVGVGGAIRAR
jgi:hypothetical protein